MRQSDILAYYSRPEIAAQLLAVARDREVIGATRDSSYLKRPDMLGYPADIIERVRRGAVSFHCSIERWRNPMALSTALTSEQLNELRTGFDFILDIDAKAKFEHARTAAVVVCEMLADFGVRPTVKFSGRRGFHIAIAAEAFPASIDFKPTAAQYPAIPQAVAAFVKESVSDKLLEALIQQEGGVAALASCIKGLPELTAYAFVELESNWSSRHLFRAPYSLHEKSWLISLPIRLFELPKFRPESAKFIAKPSVPFLQNKPEEATELLIQALDRAAKRIPQKPAIEVRARGGQPIPEEFFPPCLKAILAGLTDGRKRSLFTLYTFLRSVNWPAERIEGRIREWNTKNANPLPARLLSTQLKWHKRQSRTLMPANCDSELFYGSLGICKRTPNCAKNPVNYAFKTFAQTQKVIKLKKEYR